jgi:hypothetical protein
MRKSTFLFWTIVSLSLSACGKDDGEACNPQSENDCGSGFDDTESSCLACPASSGYSNVQGVCTTGLQASTSACAEAWPEAAGAQCDGAWTCAYDGQATPMCGAACNYSGSQRSQTCAVLASMVESGNAGQCCTVCR